MIPENDYQEVKRIFEENKEEASKLNRAAIMRISEAHMKAYAITNEDIFETTAISLKKYAEALETFKGKDRCVYDLVVGDANRDIPMFIEMLEGFLEVEGEILSGVRDITEVCIKENRGEIKHMLEEKDMNGIWARGDSSYQMLINKIDGYLTKKGITDPDDKRSTRAIETASFMFMDAVKNIWSEVYG